MWTKICGITLVSDAVMIADAGADAIGLNFYAGSKRCVDPVVARQIRDAVAADLNVVGVFVNASAAEVVHTARSVGLHSVQFHGDETVDVLAEFQRQCPEVGIVRAFRIGSDGTTGMEAALQQIGAAGIPLKAVLVDALVAGEYGGTGHQVDPACLQNRPPYWPPLILAGGLTPTTVASAVRSVRPWGVDTASGVELSPGVKCSSLVRQFVAAANADAD